MKAPMPERIQIGPFAFGVSGDPKAIAEARRNGEDGRLGETDPVKLTIVIDTDLPSGQIRDSVLHETLHAVVYTAGKWEKGIAEEQAIARFCPLLLDTLRRNPALVAYLMADDDEVADGR